ncbi:MAG: DNA repair protein RecO [Lachnospiraceae bacterium]|nr:DNA repair protein RecO [Lachnospiraceae bacterium]
MNDTTTVTGMVISVMPIGEYDKRVLLLTRELGKVSAFARGARRPNSPLVSSARLFSFGTMELSEGRTAYGVRSAQIRERFEYLAQDPEAMCYASYFAEWADYYGRENTDGSRLLLLLVLALRALNNEKLSRPLIRYVFELAVMQAEGEYYPAPRIPVCASAAYAWQYVLTASPERLFAFGLDETALADFSRAVDDMKENFIDREFRSLEVLREFRELMLSK